MKYLFIMILLAADTYFYPKEFSFFANIKKYTIFVKYGS